MARQSELDELRKEVEALRRGQGMHPLGDEAAAAFKDINQSLSAPLTETKAIAAPVEPSTPAATSEWPEPLAVQPAAGSEPDAKPKRKRAPAKPKAEAAAKATAPKPVVTAKVAARRAAATPPAKAVEVAEPKPKPARKPRKKATTS
jgi:sec-independent protein translocase protein TatB